MANLHVTAQLLCALDLPGRHQVQHCHMVRNVHHMPGAACQQSDSASEHVLHCRLCCNL